MTTSSTSRNARTRTWLIQILIMNFNYKFCIGHFIFYGYPFSLDFQKLINLIYTIFIINQRQLCCHAKYAFMEND